jgi:hypothetical protein
LVGIVNRLLDFWGLRLYFNAVVVRIYKCDVGIRPIFVAKTENIDL